jgi:ribonucleoside-diphosphate reductase beta chain
VGEERVTTQFSGLVMAYDNQSEEAFLTSQQVDEARHAQFFSRFYDTVFSIGGGMDAQLQDVRAEVNEFAFNALSRRLKVIGVGLPG